MKTFWLYIILILMTLSACGMQLDKTVEAAELLQETTQSNDSDETLLLWEGSALFAENQTVCHRLRITTPGQAFIGPCDGEQTEVEFVTNQNGGLTDMISRFAPFQADTPPRRITFNGQGEIGGPAWERAISNWAQFTYAELASGRIGAANRTALAWNLGEQNRQCRMLLVLAHGYTTAGLTPCEGGQMEVLATGWIDTAEWEQFDGWLNNRAPFYQDNSYLDGRGTTEMTIDEANALAKWAEEVYAKLTQSAIKD